MARLRLALLCLLLVSPAWANPGDTRFMAWNISNFWHVSGQPLRVSERGASLIRISSDYDAIRAVIGQIGPDIVGLQEMGSPQSVRALFPEAEWGLLFEGRFQEDLGRGRFSTKDARNRDIYTAIVWRRGSAKLLRSERIRSLAFSEKRPGRRRYSSREGIAGLFRIGEFDLWVVSIHLKSGCWGEKRTVAAVTATEQVEPVLAASDGAEDPDPEQAEDEAEEEPADPQVNPVCLRLGEQLQALETWLDEKLATGTPVVVLGDFNREFGGKDDPVYADLNDGDPVELHFVPHREKLPCRSYRETPKTSIDYIVVSKNIPNFRRRVRRNPNPKYGLLSAKISDHCPVWLDINLRGLR